MTHVYVVRCKFTAPDKEQAWNEWYSGPKIKQMLAQPFFLSCQRFRRAAGQGRDYLALWTLEKAEALKTSQYISQWGFAEWAPHVTDWSRDVFDAGAQPFRDFAVARDGLLEVISFDGMSAEDAQASRARVSAPGMMWLSIAGLDRHTPLMGVEPLRGRVPLGPFAFKGQCGTYRPVCEFHTAPRASSGNGTG